MADGEPNSGLVFRYNVVGQGEYGIKGSGVAAGEPTLRAFFPDARVQGNVFIGRSSARYPEGNTVIGDAKDAGFVDAAGGDWRLRPESRFKGAANGRDPGADVETLRRVVGGRM
jgi:hypothetical protein